MLVWCDLLRLFGVCFDVMCCVVCVVCVLMCVCYVGLNLDWLGSVLLSYVLVCCVAFCSVVSLVGLVLGRCVVLFCVCRVLCDVMLRSC